MCAGSEVGRLLLRPGPLAAGILDPCAPAVVLSARQTPPEGGFPLLKIYELPVNASGAARAALHTFRGFPATKVPENRATIVDPSSFSDSSADVFVRSVSSSALRDTTVETR